MTDALGRKTTYAYDDAHRVISMTDALGGVVSVGYDAAGQRTSLTNPLGKTTTYTYNSLGNQLTKTDPLNRTHTNTYNLAGELTRATDARGVIVDFAYDLAGRLTTQTIPGGTVGFGYDDADRQTSMTDPSGTTSWVYDAASRVTSVASPQGAISYTYNNADDRLTMTLPGNRTATYGYDTSARLSSITDWQSRTTSLTYDSNSNRTGINRPNGVNSTYSYDLADRVTSITHTGPGGTLKNFTYTYDAVGNRKSVTAAAGTESYVFDALNRITSATYTNGDLIEYTYDANGNRITKKVNGATTNTYAYDNADQLSSDGSISYTYDNNGNVTAAGTSTYTWDYANRMTGATVGGTSTTYTYAGDDVRGSKTVGGNTTSYLWDRESGLPMMVGDGTNWYLHADNLIAEVDNANAAKYPLNDALGSVRGLADGTGVLAGSADYDVFGAVRAASGSSSKFGFTGEQSDSETGFTYLRARYLHPSLGRFGSADSVQPNAPGTQGYNLFSYAAYNPSTWTDPSGHSVGAAWAAVAAAAITTWPAAFIGACICIVIVILVCALTPACSMDLFDFWDHIGGGGGGDDPDDGGGDDPDDGGGDDPDDSGGDDPDDGGGDDPDDGGGDDPDDGGDDTPLPTPEPPPPPPPPTPEPPEPTPPPASGACQEGVLALNVQAGLEEVTLQGAAIVNDFLGCSRFSYNAAGVPVRFADDGYFTASPPAGLDLPHGTLAAMVCDAYVGPTPEDARCEGRRREIVVNSLCWGKVEDWGSTMAHELGHAIGYSHSDDRNKRIWFMYLDEPLPAGAYVGENEAIVCEL